MAAERTAFAALQRPEHGRWEGLKEVGGQDRARASPPCFDTGPPIMQPEGITLFVSKEFGKDEKP